MAIKPEDRPKLIGLIVALLGVIVYVVVALVPRLAAAAAPAAHVDSPPPALTSASATTTAGQQTTGGDASAALPDEDNAPVPPAPSRDTFTPPAATVQRRAPIQPITPIPAPMGPPVMQGGMPQPGITGVGPAQVIAPPKPVLPPIELKGVILGDPSVAVIRVNTEIVERQAGEIIAGDLRLAKIADVGITVQDGKRYVPVTVGHMMPGTEGPNAPVAPVAAAEVAKTSP